MKNLFLIIISASLFLISSCNTNKNKIENTDKKTSTIVENTFDIPYLCKDTIIHVKSRKLTVKVQNPKHENIKGCFADLKMYGDFVGVEYIFHWNLPDKGDTAVSIYNQGANATLQVSNKNGLLVTNKFPKGINENTTIIYQLENN